MRRRGRESEGEGRDPHPQRQPTGAAGTTIHPSPGTQGEGTRVRSPAPGGACPGAAAPCSPKPSGLRKHEGKGGGGQTPPGQIQPSGVQTRGLSRRRGARKNSARTPPPSHPTLNLPGGGGKEAALNKKPNHAFFLPLPEAIRTHPPHACRPQALGK